MSKVGKVVIVVALVAVVAGVVALKQKRASPMTPQPAVPPAAQAETPAPPAALPRLVDLGAKKCIPCKMMAPILEELKTEYEGKLQVDFVDVWENPGAGQEYGIRVIPTQIFFDPSGNELLRHEGFMSKEDILARWKELGVDLTGSGQ